MNDKASKTSTISSARMSQILDRLKNVTTRDSTAKNYYAIWKLFNNFVIRLDKKPDSWEQRISLFGAHLVQKGNQSSTIKSYFSAIRKILETDGYELKQDELSLGTLTKACQIINDRVTIRSPIHWKMMEQVLFETERIFCNQFYLQTMYKCIFIIAHYGLFRIGELTYSNHVARACDMSVGTNKNKIRIELHSSKTHNKESKPQVIKISEIQGSQARKKFFCPFKIFRSYKKLRGPYKENNEPFFIFRDHQAVMPGHARSVLCTAITKLGFNPKKFVFHCFRSGRATELLKLGYTIEQIMRFGRWRSNAVFKYLK